MIGPTRRGRGIFSSAPQHRSVSMISLLQDLSRLTTSVGAAAFSKDGTTFATAGFYRDNSIRVWERKSLSPVTRLRGHKKRVTDLAFDDRGSRLVSASMDGTVAVWDLAQRACSASHARHGKPVTSIAFAGARRLVASGGQDGGLCLWDGKPGSRPQALGAHPGRVNAVAVAPSGDMVVTGGGIERGAFAIRVWDVRTQRELHQL